MSTKKSDMGDLAGRSSVSEGGPTGVAGPTGKAASEADRAAWDRLAALTSGRPNVHDALGITIDEVSADRVVVSVPVTGRVHQPLGLLHGGVSALLAESAASIGGALNVGPKQGVVGVELNASHLRGVSDGVISAVATPVRTGRTLQVWDIAVSDDHGRAICRSRCTLAVIDLPDVPPGG